MVRRLRKLLTNPLLTNCVHKLRKMLHCKTLCQPLANRLFITSEIYYYHLAHWRGFDLEAWLKITQ